MSYGSSHWCHIKKSEPIMPKGLYRGQGPQHNVTLRRSPAVMQVKRPLEFTRLENSTGFRGLFCSTPALAFQDLEEAIAEPFRDFFASRFRFETYIKIRSLCFAL